MGHLSWKLVSLLGCSNRPPVTHTETGTGPSRSVTMSLIDFAKGEPVAPSTSNISITDIFTNADKPKCPDACFRPVGMTFDNQGRLFVSSDASGEIYVLVADAVAGGGNPSSNGTFIGPRSAFQEGFHPLLF